MYLSVEYPKFPAARPICVGENFSGVGEKVYLGEKGEKADIKDAAAVSTPFDLASSTKMLEKGFSKIYQRYFVNLLRKSIILKFEKSASKASEYEFVIVKFSIIPFECKIFNASSLSIGFEIILPSKSITLSAPRTISPFFF